MLIPQPGWSWDMVTIEVATAGRIILSCDGQREDYRFQKSTKQVHSWSFWILGQLAAKPEWRNPPCHDPEHERVRRRFRRLKDDLTAMVPLPDRPFRKHKGAWIPVFTVKFHPNMQKILDGVAGDEAEPDDLEDWHPLSPKNYEGKLR